MDSATCPVCGERRAVSMNGLLRGHGPVGRKCDGSYRSPLIWRRAPIPEGGEDL